MTRSSAAALGLSTICALTLIGCGSEADTLNRVPDLGEGGPNLPATMDGNPTPQCQGCFDQLVAETNLCGPALEVCISDPSLMVEAIVACFATDGRCYDEALQRSASCNMSCGDNAQAQVELCTGQCFLTRAGCAENAIREADRCFATCLTAQDCNLCSAIGQLAFDQCNANGQSCADTCVATHRGG